MGSEAGAEEEGPGALSPVLSSVALCNKICKFITKTPGFPSIFPCYL